MKIIWHGTASVEIVNEYGRLLFDPFVPLKFADIPVKLEDFDGFTDIFITHGHFDHIVNLPQIVKRNPDVRIYCTGMPLSTLLHKGIPEKNLRKIDYGEVICVNGFTVNTYHGRHAKIPYNSFKRILKMLLSPEKSNILHILKAHLTCKENDETLFFHIESNGETVSVMGSLNIRDDVEYPVDADVLVLPYNGWEDNYTPAVEIIKKLHPKKVILDHYDNSFPPFTTKMDLKPILEFGGEKIRAMQLGTVVETKDDLSEVGELLLR